MKMNFEHLAKSARHLAGDHPKRADVILKESLHHDILYAIEQSELARDLVFQGGTALRLCYSSLRYSEDLDFVRGGNPLDADKLRRFEEVLQAVAAERYGLSVRVKKPKKLLTENSTAVSVEVHRWTAVIEVPGKGERHPKIHIEVADVPAHDARPRTVTNPHGAAYGDARPVLLNVSSEEEILADKIIAVAGRAHLKARDIWDIKWLTDRGIRLNLDLVRAKAVDYHLVEDSMVPLIGRLSSKLTEMAKPETYAAFKQELSRFLDQTEARRWFDDDLRGQSILMQAGEVVERAIEGLKAPASTHAQGTDTQQKLEAWRRRHAPNS